MPIRYMITADGGFLCGDTETGLAAFAYPTSPHAEQAKRCPDTIARHMIAAEPTVAHGRYATPGIEERDRRWIAQLLQTGKECTT